MGTKILPAPSVDRPLLSPVAAQRLPGLYRSQHQRCNDRLHLRRAAVLFDAGLRQHHSYLAALLSACFSQTMRPCEKERHCRSVLTLPQFCLESTLLEFKPPKRLYTKDAAWGMVYFRAPLEATVYGHGELRSNHKLSPSPYGITDNGSMEIADLKAASFPPLRDPSLYLHTFLLHFLV